MKKLCGMVAVMVSMLAMPAFALDLQSARAQGVVGETQKGYVEAIANTPEVNKLVGEVNAARMVEYGRISKENGQPVDVVAKIAAGKIIGGLGKGAHYQGANGKWTVK
jgi:uncharacterized protein YdbL (DUF1318 family)